jgi:cobaltochelatase CobT
LRPSAPAPWTGVKGNLDILAEARVRSDAIGRARTAEEVPATAVGLIARQRLTGAEPPAAAREGLKLISEWIEERPAPNSTHWR